MGKLKSNGEQDEIGGHYNHRTKYEILVVLSLHGYLQQKRKYYNRS